jgi:hypothetical protein
MRSTLELRVGGHVHSATLGSNGSVCMREVIDTACSRTRHSLPRCLIPPLRRRFDHILSIYGLNSLARSRSRSFQQFCEIVVLLQRIHWRIRGSLTEGVAGRRDGVMLIRRGHFGSGRGFTFVVFGNRVRWRRVCTVRRASDLAGAHLVVVRVCYHVGLYATRSEPRNQTKPKVEGRELSGRKCKQMNQDLNAIIQYGIRGTQETRWRLQSSATSNRFCMRRAIMFGLFSRRAHCLA